MGKWIFIIKIEKIIVHDIKVEKMCSDGNNHNIILNVEQNILCFLLLFYKIVPVFLW